MIDGRKFDVTIHVLLTSVRPVRIYLNGSYVMRVASQDYEPFDVDKKAANIVHDVNLNRFTKLESLQPFIEPGASYRQVLGNNDQQTM